MTHPPKALKPQQVWTCVSNWKAKHGTIVWQGVGSGKTLSAIVTGHLMMKYRRVQRCIVLVHRRSLADNATAELQDFYTDADRPNMIRQVESKLGKLPESIDINAEEVLQDIDTLPLAGTDTLHSGATLDVDPQPRWQVFTIQTLYSLFARQRPPTFANAKVAGTLADAVPASRHWRHTFTALFRESLLVVDEAHLLRSSLRHHAPSRPVAGRWLPDDSPPEAAIRWHIVRVRPPAGGEILVLHWLGDGGQLDPSATPPPQPLQAGGWRPIGTVRGEHADYPQATAAAMQQLLAPHRGSDIVLVADRKTLNYLHSACPELPHVHFQLATLREPAGGGGSLLDRLQAALQRLRAGAAVRADPSARPAPPPPTDDEIQSSFGEAVLFWAAHAKFVMLLTATPVYNRISDMVPLARAIFSSPADWQLVESGGRPAEGEAPWKFSPTDLSYQGRVRVHAGYQSELVEWGRQSVLYAPPLPASQAASRSRLHLLLLPLRHPAQIAQLRERCATLRNWSPQSRHQHLEAYTQLRKLTNTFQQGATWTNPKAAQIAEMIRWRHSVLTAGPYRVLVFCNFKMQAAGGTASLADALRPALSEWTWHAGSWTEPDSAKPSFARIDGSVDKDGVAAMLERYRSVTGHSTPTVLLCTRDLAGEGVSFFGVRDVFLEDMPWSPAALRQLVGRAVRGAESHRGLSWNCVDVWMLALVRPQWAAKDFRQLRGDLHADDTRSIENLQATVTTYHTAPGEESDQSVDDIAFPRLRVWALPGSESPLPQVCTADEKMLTLIATKQRRNAQFLRTLQAAAAPTDAPATFEQQRLDDSTSPGADSPAVPDELNRDYGVYYRLPNTLLRSTPPAMYDNHLARLPVMLHPPPSAGSDADGRRWNAFVHAKPGCSATLALEQRSPEWYELRRGALTMSQAPLIYKKKLYGPLNTMLVRLLLNRNPCIYRHADWFAYMERRALEWYKSSHLQDGETLHSVGSFFHVDTTDTPHIPWVGSPDGVITKNNTIVRLLEIKCPPTEDMFNTWRNAVQTTKAGKTAVWYQVQGCMGLGVACGKLTPTVSTDVLVYRHQNQAASTVRSLAYHIKTWKSMQKKLRRFYREKFWPEVRAALACSQQLRELLPLPLAGGGPTKRRRTQADALLKYVKKRGL